MNRITLCLASVNLALLVGCASTQELAPKALAPAKPVAAPAKVETKPNADALIEKVKSIPEPTKIVDVSPAAKQATDDFVKNGAGGAEYAVSDTTGFPESLLSLQPGRPKPKWVAPVNYSGIPSRGLTADGTTVDLVEHDWTGIILTPVLAQVAKAYVSGIQLSNVEVHPLSDGRVRIWVRVRNRDNAQIPTEVACSFKTGSQGDAVTTFYRLEIPAKGSRDVFFVSPGGGNTNYTVLVRKANHS